MKSKNGTGIFESKLKLRNPTNEEVKSNPSIIGVLEGTHFNPGGFSRNGRYYPEEEEFGFLWTEQLKNPELQERINNRTVFGTIGHDLELTENEIREGKASHFTTNHQIRKTNNPDMPYEGYAESYILNTPVGKVLKTYFEAGCGLYTSTRADGTYLEGKYKKNSKGEDVPILNPKTFQYERNDFIINPGFLEAQPKLREALDKDTLLSINESYNLIKDDKMKKNEVDTGTVIDTTKDNEIGNKDTSITDKAGGVVLPAAKGTTKDSEVDPKGTELNDKEQKTTAESATEKTIEKLLGVIETLKSKIVLLEQENDKDKDKDKGKEGDDGKGKEGDGKGKCKEGEDDKDKDKNKEGENGKDKDKKDAEENTLDNYKKIGTVTEINKALSSIKEFFLSLGKPHEIRKTLLASKESLKKYSEDINKLKLLVSKSAINEEIGSADEINTMCTKVSEFCTKHGTFEKVSESLNQLDTIIKKFGTEKEIESKVSEVDKVKLENRARKISQVSDINYDKVIEYLKKGMDEKEIVDLYNRINNTASDRYLFVEEDPKELTDDEKASQDYKDNPDESRLGRVIRKLSK